MKLILSIYVIATLIVLLLNRKTVWIVWKKALFGERGRRKRYLLTGLSQIFLWPILLLRKG